MKKFFVIGLGLFAALSLFHFEPAAATLIDISDSPDNISSSTSYGGSLRMALKTIINYFLFFLGIVATIMVIYGGFLYVTSGIDDGNVEKGKNILIYAAIGIIIVLISFALVNTLMSAGQVTPPA
jgi:hypothetical protein